MSPRLPRFGSFLLLLVATLCLLPLPTSAGLQDAIRIDVPEGVRVRIENKFGQVAAEAWKEKYVSVSASIESNGAVFKRSPIVIERKSKLLLISVIRRPIDPQVQINLAVKLPEGAHAEIVTKDGPMTMTAAVVPTESPAVVPTESPAAASPQPPKLIAEGATDKRAGTPATNTGPEEVSEGDVIRVDSQLATLNLSVIDRNTNRGIIGLGQSDFRLFEDGVEQQILKFESSSAPFDLILLIDVSGSTREVVKLIRAAALRFVEAARSSDRIGIISFAGTATLVSPVTQDRQVLRERVNAIETATGDTKAYDALDFAVSEVLKHANTRNMRRTAIVMMSDGLDGSIPGVLGDGSKISYAELVGRIREFDGVLYTLWLNTEYEAMNPLDTQPEAFDMGHDRMKDLAEAGGGVFYRVERLEDLAGAYERVVADLGTVYSLAYRPANNVRNGKWRSVKVSVSIPSAVARGKHGYYAN